MRIVFRITWRIGLGFLLALPILIPLLFAFDYAASELRQKSPDVEQLNTVVLIVIFGLWILSLIYMYIGYCIKNDKCQFLKMYSAGINWFGDMSYEFASALIVGLLVLGLITIPEKRLSEMELRTRLILDMGSKDQVLTDRAIRELRKRGGLTDGCLQGEEFINAELQGADLQDADLQNATLNGANLSRAIMVKSDLKNAKLKNAKLIGTDLRKALLEGADLSHADMRQAILKGANLRNAILWNTSITDAVFDNNTILPDGTKWTPNTDMSCFTLVMFSRSNCFPGNPAQSKITCPDQNDVTELAYNIDFGDYVVLEKGLRREWDIYHANLYFEIKSEEEGEIKVELKHQGETVQFLYVSVSKSEQFTPVVIDLLDSSWEGQPTINGELVIDELMFVFEEKRGWSKGKVWLNNIEFRP